MTSVVVVMKVDFVVVVETLVVGLKVDFVGSKVNRTGEAKATAIGAGYDGGEGDGRASSNKGNAASMREGQATEQGGPKGERGRDGGGKGNAAYWMGERSDGEVKGYGGNPRRALSRRKKNAYENQIQMEPENGDYAQRSERELRIEGRKKPRCVEDVNP
eukprot:Gb_14281 [translate_table: standard]